MGSKECLVSGESWLVSSLPCPFFGAALAPVAGAGAGRAFEGAVEAGKFLVAAFEGDRDDAAIRGLQQCLGVFDAQIGEIVGPRLAGCFGKERLEAAASHAQF